MKKFSFIFDNSNKALYLKKIISKKYKNYSIKNSDVIVVAGGDGFMLKTIKKLYEYKKPFYGVNCGSVGFLLNKFKRRSIPSSIYGSLISQVPKISLFTSIPRSID